MPPRITTARRACSVVSRAVIARVKLALRRRVRVRVSVAEHRTPAQAGRRLAPSVVVVVRHRLNGTRVSP
eukprot:scaffold85851_cov39-Phaeocystis_antarctica.AAC.1